MCKFPGHAYIHSIFDIFFAKAHIYKVQTLNLRNVKFEQNCSYIGGVDISLVGVYIGIFKLVEDSDFWSLWLNLFDEITVDVNHICRIYGMNKPPQSDQGSKGGVL